jgi:hypothetical protein
VLTPTVLAAQIVASSPPLPAADAAPLLARLDSPAIRTGRFVCVGLRRAACRDHSIESYRWPVRSVPAAAAVSSAELLFVRCT